MVPMEFCAEPYTRGLGASEMFAEMRWATAGTGCACARRWAACCPWDSDADDLKVSIVVPSGNGGRRVGSPSNTVGEP